MFRRTRAHNNKNNNNNNNNNNLTWPGFKVIGHSGDESRMPRVVFQHPSTATNKLHQQLPPPPPPQNSTRSIPDAKGAVLLWM